jgi:hypothetical protein
VGSCLRLPAAFDLCRYVRCCVQPLSAAVRVIAVCIQCARGPTWIDFCAKMSAFASWAESFKADQRLLWATSVGHRDPSFRSRSHVFAHVW